MDKRIKSIKQFTHKNIDKRITTKKAAEMTNLSYCYFSELFKKEVGVTFSRYLKKTKMRKAKNLLRNSSLSIKEISFEIGFRYVSSFCEEFKRVVGSSPTAYRRKSKVIKGLNQISQVIQKLSNIIVKISNRNRKYSKRK
jgi:two-component system response regulator YesN